MNVIQSVSGDKELIDFAVTEDNKQADIYTIHVNSLKKDDIQSKINEYITLIDKNVPWRNLKKETDKSIKVSDELFNVVSAFLKGSTRGRSNSLFEEDLKEPPTKKRKTTSDNGDNGGDDGNNGEPEIVYLEIDLMNDIEYGNMEDLITAINENIERRKEQLIDWGKKWDSMTPEEIEQIDKAYDEQIRKEQEEDPNYNPDDSEYETDYENENENENSSDTEESLGSSDTDTDDDSESIIDQAIADIFNEVNKEAEQEIAKEDSEQKNDGNDQKK